MNRRIKPTDGSLEEKQTSKTKKAKESTAKSFDITPKFLEDLENLFIAGVPARDEKGHSEMFSFRGRPMQKDIVHRISEMCPKEWFKSNSALTRSIFAIGCRVVLEILNKKHGKKVEKLIKIMNDLNLISRKLREVELEREIASLQNRVVRNGTTRDAFKLREKERELKELI